MYSGLISVVSVDCYAGFMTFQEIFWSGFYELSRRLIDSCSNRVDEILPILSFTIL